MLSPAEFEVDGVGYRCRRLSAADQHALLRQVRPVLPALSAVDTGLRLPNLTPMDLARLLSPMREIEEATLRLAFDACLQACERQDGAPMARPGLAVLVSIVMQVVAVNFATFLTMPRPEFEPVPTSKDDRGFGSYGPVTLPDGEDDLYRPMVAGMCSYRELHDGSLQIEDVAKMNDIIAVRGENEARLRFVAEDN